MTMPAYRCDVCDDPTTNPEDEHGEFICDSCRATATNGHGNACAKTDQARRCKNSK